MGIELVDLGDEGRAQDLAMTVLGVELPATVGAGDDEGFGGDIDSEGA
ncbi:MAG: hypothetical protein WDN28_30175 [Chthoniobacter sp.]